jgi:hypothetical protein
LRRELLFIHTKLFPLCANWMLRDLTTQEYIRLRRVAKQELADAEVLAYHELSESGVSSTAEVGEAGIKMIALRWGTL